MQFIILFYKSIEIVGTYILVSMTWYDIAVVVLKYRKRGLITLSITLIWTAIKFVTH